MWECPGAGAVGDPRRPDYAVTKGASRKGFAGCMIHGLSEDRMETNLQTEAAPAQPTPAQLSATWRRWLAFLIDWIILSLGGYIVGMLFFDPLSRLGPWARVLGFAVALVYFGIFDSGWGGAGSPGKKVLGIRVVDAAGRVIGMGRSFARAALICAPLILNDFFIVPPPGAFGELAFNGLVGGWMTATLYMLAFNRRTKQGIHDLATGTFVIRGRATRQSLAGYALWKPHLGIAAALVALSVPVALARLPVSLHFAPGVSRHVDKAPDTGPVEVVGAWLSWKPLKAGASGKPECLSARIQLRGTGVADEQVARDITMRLIALYHCQVVTNVSVRMQYGFNMGFSSGTAFHDFVIDEADLTR